MPEPPRILRNTPSLVEFLEAGLSGDARLIILPIKTERYFNKVDCNAAQIPLARGSNVFDCGSRFFHGFRRVSVSRLRSTFLTVMRMLFGIKSSFAAPMAASSADLDGISKRFGRSADSLPRNFEESFIMSKNQLVLTCALKTAEVDSIQIFLRILCLGFWTRFSAAVENSTPAFRRPP
jgi:hypothetical protein